MNPSRGTKRALRPTAFAILLAIATMPVFAQGCAPATAANHSANCCPGHVHQERPRENCIEERDSAIECIHQPAIRRTRKIILRIRDRTIRELRQQDGFLKPRTSRCGRAATEPPSQTRRARKRHPRRIRRRRSLRTTILAKHCHSKRSVLVRGTHPCKVRKDGAPSVVVIPAKNKGWATCGLSTRCSQEVNSPFEQDRRS